MAGNGNETAYGGVMPPLVSPLTDDGTAICEQSVKRLIESLRPHVSGVIAALSSGEGWKLSDDQWHDMASYTKKHAGDLPVFVGIMRPSTREVVGLARHAEDLGVDGLAITSPFGEAVSQEQIFDHYREVSAATSLPIFVYNEASVSKNETSFETLAKVAGLETVKGMKESSGSAELIRRLLEAELGIAVFQGWENLCVESRGVNGYVMALANLEPAMCRETLAEPTLQRQQAMVDYCNDNGLFASDWFLAIKKALKQRGVISSSATV